jgi:integrase
VEKEKVRRFRHTFATWAIENEARDLDVQHLLGHSTPAMVRRYSATYDAEKAARAHERFSPADRMGERLG